MRARADDGRGRRTRELYHHTHGETCRAATASCRAQCQQVTLRRHRHLRHHRRAPPHPLTRPPWRDARADSGGTPNVPRVAVRPSAAFRVLPGRRNTMVFRRIRSATKRRCNEIILTSRWAKNVPRSVLGDAGAGNRRKLSRWEQI